MGFAQCDEFARTLSNYEYFKKSGHGMPAPYVFNGGP
jgi:hypothetical protein